MIITTYDGDGVPGQIISGPDEWVVMQARDANFIVGSYPASEWRILDGVPQPYEPSKTEDDPYDPLNAVLERTPFMIMLRFLGKQMGIDLVSQIRFVISNMPEDTIEEMIEKSTAETLFEDGQQFHRNHPFMSMIADNLYVSDLDVDNAWREASVLVW